MKTVVLSAMIVAKLISCSYPSQEIKKEKKNYLQANNLKGKVKSVRTISYEAVEKFGKPQKAEISSSPSKNNFYIFNEQGNVLEIKDFKPDGSPNRKETYKYNDKDYIDEVAIAIYISDGNLSQKGTYKHDDKGNIMETNIYNSDGSLYLKITYKYDDKGNIIEVDTYDSDGNLSEKKNFQAR